MVYNPNIRHIFVDPMTGEERSPSRGDPRFMKVETKDDGFEYVTMANVVMEDDSTIIVKPHGKGWERYDTSSDKWFVWRRKARTVLNLRSWR